MAQILVTGSSGFLGSETVQHMKTLGHDVFGVDCVAGEFTDKVQDVCEFIKNNTAEFDVVFHFAAKVGGRENIENNYLQMIQNIEIDRVVFEWAKSNVKHIVYPSSSAVYPVNFQDTYDEFEKLSEDMIDFNTNTIGVSDHLYGWCKLTAERMLWEINKKSDIKITIFRPFSGYGTNQSPDYPFPNLVKEVKSNPTRVQVWGTGKQIRDFIHIKDILHAFEKSLDFNDKFLTLNLGSGVGTCFNDLVKNIAKVLYNVNDVQIDNLTDKPVGVLARVADVNKQQKYDLLPRISLDRGIILFNEK